MSKPKRDPMVAASVLKATELTSSKSEAKKLNPPQENVIELISLASQVAGSAVSVGNWKWKNADQHFPYDPLMRRVDKYFGSAKGGPLFVDEPVTAYDVKMCQKKRACMLKEGLRYVYIEKDMDLDDVLEQLETKEAA